MFTIPNKRGIIDSGGGGKMIDISSEQFGKKIGKHAYDYGLDPNNIDDRAKMNDIINDIVNNHDEIRRGAFRGQIGEVDFYIKDNDVVIVNNSEFVTILKDGINNERVKESKAR